MLQMNDLAVSHRRDCAANSPLTSSIQLNLPAGALSHRLLSGVSKLLEAAGKNEIRAVEACASAEVLGRSLQDAKCTILRKKPETRSPLLLALGGMSRRAAKSMRKSAKAVPCRSALIHPDRHLE